MSALIYFEPEVFFDYFIDIIAICFCFIFRTLDNLFITFWSPTELLMSCLPDFKKIYLWLSAFDCDISACRYLCNYLTWSSLYFWMYRLIFFTNLEYFKPLLLQIFFSALFSLSSPFSIMYISMLLMKVLVTQSCLGDWDGLHGL